MADHVGEHEKHESESFIDKITEKFHDGSSSSSDSDSDDKDLKSAAASVKSKIYRLFGREKPVHKVLGAGKPADIFLWRDKKVTAGVVGVGTAIWVLFEILEYHLLTLVCHILILGLAILFLWSNASAFINKSPPKFPEVILPEDIVLGVASALRIEFNRGFAIIREIASVSGDCIWKRSEEIPYCDYWTLDSFDSGKLLQLSDFVLHIVYWIAHSARAL